MVVDAEMHSDEEAGLLAAGRSSDDFTVHACPIVCTGSTDEVSQVAANTAAHASQRSETNQRAPSGGSFIGK